MQVPPDEQAYAERLSTYERLGAEVDREADTARQLILNIIADTSTPSDNAGLARLEYRIDNAAHEVRNRMNRDMPALLGHLERHEFDQVRILLRQMDELRDEFSAKIDTVRSDMLKQVDAGAANVMADQRSAILISAIVTALAAATGFVFALIVSGGITRPVQQLLQRARDVEAGRLDQSVAVVGRDEIGQLSQAFNSMVEQLRQSARIRDTFGRYIDPQVAKGLLSQSSGTTEGQRQTMTVMFCDMKGFTAMSEGMTPRGLVKVMNRYFTTMSEPIRERHGIIDKYIGDAIMAWWGPPFVQAVEEATLACHAAVDMLGRAAPLREALPELIGVKSLKIDIDVRIGIATGDVLVGSIGSELMMSYTVMGDAVNLASRLEHANNHYGTRILASDAVVASLGAEFDVREVDRLVAAGQSTAITVYEIMGRTGDLTLNQLRLRELYGEALAAYRARRWDDAKRLLDESLQTIPGDGPSSTLLRRIGELQLSPPAEDWDGAWTLPK